MQPHIIEKQGVPVIIDPNTKEPVALIYFSKDRERIIYLLSKATEEDIIELLTGTNPQSYEDGKPTKASTGHADLNQANAITK